MKSSLKKNGKRVHIVVKVLRVKCQHSAVKVTCETKGTTQRQHFSFNLEVTFDFVVEYEI